MDGEINTRSNLPLLTNQGVERLCSFLDGLVEGLRGRVAILAEDLILSQEETLYTNSQIMSLRCEK